jgi:hypothetical protein
MVINLMTMRNFIRLSLVLICISICIAAQVQPGAACTATVTGNPPETLSFRVSQAGVILEGVVVAVRPDSFGETATIEVMQYLKGSGPAQVTMNNFGSSSMCLTSVKAGDHLIFYAAGDPAAGLRAYYSSAGQAVASPSAELISAITTYIGTAPLVFQSSTEVAQTQEVATHIAEFSLTETAAVQPVSQSRTPSPAAFVPMATFNQIATEAWATVAAAPVLYPGDPARLAQAQTDVYPTIEMLYTAYASLSTPTPTPFGVPPPPAAATGDPLRLLGIGVGIGLLLGGLAGIAVGFWLSRWRE